MSLRVRYRYKFCRRFQIDIWGDLTKSLRFENGVLTMSKLARRVKYSIYRKAIYVNNPKLYIYRVDRPPELMEMRLKQKWNLNFNAMKHGVFEFYANINRKQFKKLFIKCRQTKGYFTNVFLNCLELRLDTVLFRMNFVSTFREARQLIMHHKIFVNGCSQNYLEFKVSCFDRIDFDPETAKRLFIKFINRLIFFQIPCNYPKYMHVDYQLMVGFIHTIPINISEIPFFFKFPRDRAFMLYYHNFR